MWHVMLFELTNVICFNLFLRKKLFLQKKENFFNTKKNIFATQKKNVRKCIFLKEHKPEAFLCASMLQI